MKKRVLSVLLIICMTLTLLPLSAAAKDPEPVIVKTVGPLTIYIQNGEAYVKSCERNTRDSVTVPAEVDGVPVTRISTGAFQYSAVREVVIPECVTVIDPYAFYEADSLKRVVLPQGLISIGDYAFMGSSALQSVNLPDTLQSIGKYAFSELDSLTEIAFPDSLKIIDDYAFENNNLVSVTIPAQVERIGSGAFSRSMFLKSVTLPEGLKEIGALAFEDCYALEQINLPAHLERLGSRAFAGCRVLKDLKLPAALTYWGKDAVEPEKISAEQIHKEGGAIYALTYLIQVEDTCKKLVVRDDTTVISEKLCWNNETIESAEINGMVKRIEPETFYQCTKLSSVKLPDTLESIGARAFTQCRFQSIHFPDTLTTIEDEAFRATALTEVSLPDSVTSLGVSQFESCGDLASVRLSNNLKCIPASCFSGCKQLKSIEIPEGVEEIETEAFEACYGLESISLPMSLKAVEQDSFDPGIRSAKVTYPGTRGDWIKIKRITDSYIQYPGDTTEESPKPTAKPDDTKTKFSDVDKDAFYADAVAWAVSQDPVITAGTDSTHFSPNNVCTRAQMVTFLWRAAGEPEVLDPSSNPFRDVKESDYFYKAVRWALWEGITTGTSKNTFSPDATVTRAQTVTFLWRMEGQPEVKVKNPFKDTKSGQYYYDAVLWAVENEITTGTSATTFAPNDPCTRAQIVTFLYRDLG